MLNTLKDRLNEQKLGYRVPRSTQDRIPIQRIYGSSGIFLVDNRYTKSFKFKDINYMMSSYDYRVEICQKWAGIINALDVTAITKVTIFNRPTSIQDFDTGIYLQADDNRFNKSMMNVASEFNRIIDRKSEQNKGMMQDKYLTVSIVRDNYEEAVEFFNTLQEDMTDELQSMGSDISPMDSNERMFVLHSFFHRGDEYRPVIDPDSKYFGRDFENYIAPSHIKKKTNYLIIDDKYVRSFYLVTFSNTLTDQLVGAITKVSSNMVVSVDIIPIPQVEASKFVRDCSRQADEELHNWKESNPDSTLPPSDKLNKQDGCRAWDDDLNLNDERMLLACVTITLSCDSKEQMEKQTIQLGKSVKSASSSNTQVDIALFQQFDALNTCLPYGCWTVPQLRTLNTSSLSVLTPFRCLDLQEEGGVHIGENEISKNFVVFNEENIINQSFITCGKPGGGKSMLIKWIQLQRIFKTDYKYIIVDPEGEYAALYEALCPEMCSIVRMGSSKNVINCMEMTKNYGIEGNDDGFLTKSQFVMSLLNQADPGHPISLAEKSILDRCVVLTYKHFMKTQIMPTLSVLRQIVSEQEEEEAKELALKLELFTSGSLKMFGQESTVDIYSKRIVIFDLHGMREIQKPIGLFVLSDAIINMVTMNWENKEKTYIDFDEAQVLLADNNTAQFFDGAYRQWRKRNGIPNAITQNANVFQRDNVQKDMLANSEAVFMMSQSPSDLDFLSRYYNLSDEQTRWLKKSRTGAGLFKYGNNFIPFSNELPKNTMIYKLLSTKRNEGAFGNESYRSEGKVQ